MTPEEVREEVSRIPHHDEAGVIRIPRIQSWSDVIAVLSLGGLILGGVAWGLRLENRYSNLDSRISAHRTEVQQLIEQVRVEIATVNSGVIDIKALVQRGVLPVTEVRLQTIESRLTEIEHEHQQERFRLRDEQRSK